MRIATPLFAFGKNADIGHWFAMTENPLCRQSDRPACAGRFFLPFSRWTSVET
jgi:hypothetical protein